MLEEFTYPSFDNITTIHAMLWKPKGEIKAIIQVSHGMMSHISTYEGFAHFCNQHHILVCGNDTLGHGKSIIDTEHLGYFAKRKPDNVVVTDMHTLTLKMKEAYPNIPYFILGHSMGSFITREYIEMFNDDITGVIISGSLYRSPLYMKWVKFVTFIIQFYHHGWFYRSPYLYKHTGTIFSRRFEEEKDNPFCWLTSNENALDRYKKDKLSHFKFTCNGYYGLFTFIDKACNKRLCRRVKKDIAMLIISGKDDPVGRFGQDIFKIEKLYKSVGIKDIKIKIYNSMRHDLLNEEDNILVYNDILNFINKH